VVREAEAATADLRQAKDDVEQKRQQAEQQIAKLQQRVALATKQQRSLQYELTVAKENGSALQELIDVHQRKLRDDAAVATTSPVPEVRKPFDPSAIPVPQDLPAAPAMAQPAPAPTPAPTPMPAPTAGRPKSVPPPQDDDWFSSIKNWLISVWHSVFS
jgi:TolA-binding protein